MVAKKTHKKAYNLSRKVEIPIEFQFQDVSSKSQLGQSGVKSGSDSDSIDLDIYTLVAYENKDSYKESPVVSCRKKN